MNKISITIDTTKVTKEKIITRVYNDGQGHEVIAKDYKLDIVPLREEKVVWSGADSEMVKVGFVAEAPTDEEKKAKTKTKIIGSAIEFRKKSQESTLTAQEKAEIQASKEAYGIKEDDEIDVASIPF
jgi:hypothetical protein